MNILCTNVGRRTYIIEYLLDLKAQGFNINVFVSDTSVNVAGFWVDTRVRTFITPRVMDDPNKYIETLRAKCKELSIDIIIPLMDFELPVLSKNVKTFEEFNCKIVISDKTVIQNTLNKKNNIEYCKTHGLKVPATYYSLSEINEKTELVKKRILGSGSVGLELLDNISKISSFNETEEIIQKKIIGTEYGIDILNDFDGNFLHACIKRKIEMRAGETDKAEVLYKQNLIELAQKVSKTFRHIGNMDIDVIIDKTDEVYFIDFNPRFGGGYPFTHLSGCNYLKAIIEIYMGKKPIIPEYGKNIIGMKSVSVNYYEPSS